MEVMGCCYKKFLFRYPSYTMYIDIISSLMVLKPVYATFETQLRDESNTSSEDLTCYVILNEVDWWFGNNMWPQTSGNYEKDC